MKIKFLTDSNLALGVSVLITCYNLEKYIAKSIESVLSQDYTGDVEIIVVDDGSVDSSRLIIQGFNRVKLLAIEENVGVLLATIAGIELATHELILFLDGDDVWMPDKIRLVADAFEQGGDIGLVTHSIDIIDERVCDFASAFLSSRIAIAPSTGSVDPVKTGIINMTGNVWLGSAYSIHKSRVDIDGFCRWATLLPSPRDTYQDWPIAYWCASNNLIKCIYLDQVLMNYRIHSSNYSGDARTVAKVLRNLRKSYFTADALCRICRIRGVQGFAKRLCHRRKLFYAYLIDLYSGRTSLAVIAFVRLQTYLIFSSQAFLKEWLRFVLVVVLGPRLFTLLIKRDF